MDNSTRIAQMKTRLTQALAPTQLEITDESHLHANHAGAQSGKGHFALRISSPQFKGKRTLQQHQMVYQALEEMMQTEIHALSIKSTS